MHEPADTEPGRKTAGTVVILARDTIGAIARTSRLGGRPAKLSPEQTRLARARYKARDVTVAEIARSLGVGRGTISRALEQTP